MAYTIGNKGTISKLYRYLIRGDTQRRLVKLHRFFFHTYLEGSKQTVSKKKKKETGILYIVLSP